MHLSKSLSRVGLSAVLCLTLLVSPVSATVNAYMQIEGAKQGTFKGEANHKGSNQWIPVLQFRQAVESPRDAATGMASGKRQHKPLTITKEWGASSPQLQQALAQKEVLRLVVIEVVRPDPKGKEVVYQTIRLKNALVSAINRGGNQTGRAPGKDTHEREEISFIYQEIEVTNDKGQKSASDDWLSTR